MSWRESPNRLFVQNQPLNKKSIQNPGLLCKAGCCSGNPICRIWSAGMELIPGKRISKSGSATDAWIGRGTVEDWKTEVGGRAKVAEAVPPSGFDNNSKFPRGVRLANNPMLRSGLALAGAQRTIEAWTRGEAVASENDGIVTAEEIGLLNLRGTRLVVLSACNTGLGEARSGEGVLGLRRGFMQAGAQNLLMTLWPIDDERTADFIADFYEADKQHGNAVKALSDVQRKWLSRLRTEKGIADACRIAGPFILSFQGNLSWRSFAIRR